MQRFAASGAVTAFAPIMASVGTVALGESFELETQDCYGGQLRVPADLRTGIDMARFNRATGPVEVRGVRVGEWVAVDLERIELEGTGVMALAPGMGVLGGRIEQASTRIVEIADGRAWLTPELGVPIRPMIGVLGVATATQTVPTSTPGDHGGNLDTPLLVEGTTLCLRANQDGLGLAAGDLHAAQGGGELGGTGIEIAGTVRLRVRKIEHEGRLPLLVSQDRVSVLASAPTLEAAVREAFDETVELLGRWHGLAWGDAYRLASVLGTAEISQVVNPLVTARVSIDAAWTPFQRGGKR